MVRVPDFGHVRPIDGDETISVRAVAPGLSLQDLVSIFERASEAASGNDSVSGDPTQWSVTRGVQAVSSAILRACYSAQDCRPTDPVPELLMACRFAVMLIGPIDASVYIQSVIDNTERDIRSVAK